MNSNSKIKNMITSKMISLQPNIPNKTFNESLSKKQIKNTEKEDGMKEEEKKAMDEIENNLESMKIHSLSASNNQRNMLN
jgi:hypothetical protein